MRLQSLRTEWAYSYLPLCDSVVSSVANKERTSSEDSEAGSYLEAIEKMEIVVLLLFAPLILLRHNLAVDKGSPILLVLLAISLSAQTIYSDPIAFHVTSVAQGDAADFCTTGQCSATRFTVEGYAAGENGTTVEYILDCVESENSFLTRLEVLDESLQRWLQNRGMSRQTRHRRSSFCPWQHSCHIAQRCSCLCSSLAWGPIVLVKQSICASNSRAQC